MEWHYIEDFQSLLKFICHYLPSTDIKNSKVVEGERDLPYGKMGVFPRVNHGPPGPFRPAECGAQCLSIHYSACPLLLWWHLRQAALTWQQEPRAELCILPQLFMTVQARGHLAPAASSQLCASCWAASGQVPGLQALQASKVLGGGMAHKGGAAASPYSKPVQRQRTDGRQWTEWEVRLGWESCNN